MCVSHQQHVKVLLHALGQLPVDFLVLPGGESESGVFIRRRALTSEPDHFAETPSGSKKRSRRWRGHSAAVDQATVVHIPGLDRHRREGVEEEEKRRKRRRQKQWPHRLQAAHHMRPGGHKHTHARRHTQACTRTHTNSSFLDEATPKTEGWFMRRSRPMGIRACSGIRLNKREESRFWQEDRIKEVGNRLCGIFWQQTEWKIPDQIFSYFLGCYITLCVKNTLNRSF